jgi:hypothetical protein
VSITDGILSIPLGQPMSDPRRHTALDTNKGPFVICADAGGAPIYLRPDDPTDGYDQMVQTFSYDPIRQDHKDFGQTMQWHITRNSDGTYTIQSNPSKRKLTYVANNSGQTKILKDGGGTSQQWDIAYVNNWLPDYYLISPVDDPRYALTSWGQGPAQDSYVVTQRMWAGPAPAFYWHIAPAPDDLKKKYA